MKASVDKFKPAKVGWKKWRYEIYSWVREIPGIQDILARWGTEWLMRRMGIDYRRLVLRTELLPECGRDDDGDNLVVIGKK